MAEGHLWLALRALADGNETVEVAGETIGQVLNGLSA